MKLFFALVASLLLTSAASAATAVASGGWEFARWGMSPAQLRAASHGAVAAANQAGGYDVMAKEDSMGSFRFAVQFDYRPRPEDPGNSAADNLILDAVMLNLDQKSGSCARLSEYLRKTLGKPDRVLASAPAGYRWRKQASGDDVQYLVGLGGKGCTVMYSPLNSN